MPAHIRTRSSRTQVSPTFRQKRGVRSQRDLPYADADRDCVAYSVGGLLDVSDQHIWDRAAELHALVGADKPCTILGAGGMCELLAVRRLPLQFTAPPGITWNRIGGYRSTLMPRSVICGLQSIGVGSRLWVVTFQRLPLTFDTS